MPARFAVLEASGRDRDVWLSALESLDRPHVFLSPAYLELFARDGERPRCAIYEEGGDVVLYPFLMRSIGALPFGGAWSGRFDLVSPPFGWGGMLGRGAGAAPGFCPRFAEWAREAGVIAEYVTFDPSKEPPAEYPGEVAYKMRSVVRSLTEPPEVIWRDYKDTVRRCIKKAERSGVSVEIDTEGTRVDAFLAVYGETMRRRAAGEDYELTRGWLEALHRSLSGGFAYFHALLAGRVVSTELVLLAGSAAVFFRGGTLAEAFAARPNHLLKHRVILWSRERGCARYVLGGGNVDGDDLLRFKLSFAPAGARPLRVGRWVVDRQAYDGLVAARRAYEREVRGRDWSPRPGYFPAYRAGGVGVEG